MANDEEVYQGSSITIDGQLRNSDGAITIYTGTEPLVTTVWPGGNRAASFHATTVWTAVSPDPNEIAITITGAQTADLDPGRYELLAQVIVGSELVDAYADTIIIKRFAGTDTAIATYTTLEDLQTYGRSWLNQVQTGEDEAGFNEQQERAKTWLDGVLHAHFRVGGPMLAAYGTSFGPGVRITGSRSTVLQAWLDTSPTLIMLNDQIREAVAKKALAIICEGMIGTDTMNSYGKLARMYHSQSEAIISGMTVSLDVDQDGFPDVHIDCSCIYPLYG